ncbi:hypothetical protein [Bradyrhizobium sp.]|uniref:hypothetical protein n=1 Tax=Bradyrhizobium sp. TaxID=376 RepID=UPI003C702C09
MSRSIREAERTITHTVDGRTCVFRAAAPRSRGVARAMRAIIGWLRNGAVAVEQIGTVDRCDFDRGTQQYRAERIEQAKHEN